MSSLQQKEKFQLTHDFVIAEYTALREEILKLTDIQHQLLTIALLSFGTLIGTGIAYKNASIILIYPIIALFLSAGWLTNAYGIDLIAHYIQNHIEIMVGPEHTGWETHSRKVSIPHSFLAFFVARAIFPVTQLIAIGAGISIANFDLLLFLIALLSTAVCLAFLVVIALAQRKRNRLIR